MRAAPVLIGGAGERKTLRFVAKYADACNLFAHEDLSHKLEVLREHCAIEGRDYGEIEKTVLFNFDPGANGEKTSGILDALATLAEIGLSVAYGSVDGVETIRPLELLGELVVAPAAAL